jgi:hypothetical protein
MARNVALAPDTPQTVGVVDAKATANPELDVAARVSGDPTVCAAMAPKVMVWPAGLTIMVWVTGAAEA